MATLALNEGIHPKVVAERLGHSTVGLTLDTYSHVTPSMQKFVPEAVSKYFSARSEWGEDIKTDDLSAK